MNDPKWYSELTPYQWRVLICASLGWALDIMDGYLYAIVLFPAMTELLGTTESAAIGWYGGIVLSIFMVGWALGGLVFGPIADRYGRAKTMPITVTPQRQTRLRAVFRPVPCSARPRSLHRRAWPRRASVPVSSVRSPRWG